MRDVYIVSAVRTPVGRKNGALSGLHPVAVASLPLQEVVRRVDLDPAAVEDVVMGCVTPIGEQGANIGRLAVLNAGWPVSVPSVTLNRMCGSSQQAIHFAAQAIAAGDMDIAVGAGVECMSRVTMGSDYPEQFYAGIPYDLIPQGISAELICDKWNLSREDLDRYSYESHQKAAAATAAGYFKAEIMPVTVAHNGSQVTLDYDEGFRSNVDLAKMGQLRPAFRADGRITAASSSQISDGAAAVLLASAEGLKRHNLTPRARIVARVVVGSDPLIMLDGPIPATRKILARAGLTIEDMDTIEINEAFASVVLAWLKEIQPDPARVNPTGGAIAIGHPLGATGAKLMATMLHRLERTGGRYGLQTMCIGHGMATATIIERV
ncbi:MAG: thiolase family protein [Anaerolineae bacterium]|jgi:acetyl-CoA acetyltransferase family protein|uniref:thiolase family protein n=1 Tax=Candidatus Amarolinea dominans TaxID=3140696 RepID=UPI001DCD3D27|nr:thiolase family protein [Anaerolineae bacterium]MBK7203501.1 thiolase family protein [Anaerolineae bacterium]MBK9229659.1 thiolase family protein [Anaerolineae bacterium]